MCSNHAIVIFDSLSSTKYHMLYKMNRMDCLDQTNWPGMSIKSYDEWNVKIKGQKRKKNLETQRKHQRAMLDHKTPQKNTIYKGFTMTFIEFPSMDSKIDFSGLI